MSELAKMTELAKRLRSGVIEWCRITHQGHVTDNTPYEAADALEKLCDDYENLDIAANLLMSEMEVGDEEVAKQKAEIERLTNCVTHHMACDCREAMLQQQALDREAEIERLKGLVQEAATDAAVYASRQTEDHEKIVEQQAEIERLRSTCAAVKELMESPDLLWVVKKRDD